MSANQLKEAFAYYLQSDKSMVIMDIGKTRVVINGKPKSEVPTFNIVVSSLPLNLELIVKIATDILMIAKPLLSLKLSLIHI